MAGRALASNNRNNNVANAAAHRVRPYMEGLVVLLHDLPLDVRLHDVSISKWLLHSRPT